KAMAARLSRSSSGKTQVGMRRIGFLLLAAASLLSAASGATRPRYGGTLRVIMQAGPNTLEIPTAGLPTGYLDSEPLLEMVGDTLVSLDTAGHTQPALATSWQGDSTSRRW